MEKTSNIKKSLLGIALAGGILIPSAYKTNEKINGATFQDYFGGKNVAEIYEGGKKEEIIVPVYPIWEVKPNHCSLYARLTTENLGNEINRGNAWDLIKNNENYEYSPEKLSKGDIVGFYNPKSKYNIGKNGEKRAYSHVATYLGKNKNGEEVYAEQRGQDSRITTASEFKEQGWIPKRIIKTKN